MTSPVIEVISHFIVDLVQALDHLVGYLMRLSSIILPIPVFRYPYPLPEYFITGDLEWDFYHYINEGGV